MKIAISVSDGFVSGPGEGDEVWIIDIKDDGSYEVVERYENPAKYAQQVRGVFMLRSVLDHGVDKVILSEIGPPGYRWAIEKGIKIYIFEGRVEDAIRAFIEGRLTEAQGPTHSEHHGYHGHHHHRHIEGFGEYDFLKPYVSGGMVIADLGCGEGYYCNFFKDYASRLYCVDIDETAIEEVRRRFSNYGNITMLNEDITRTSIPSGSVDLAFMSNVFHDIEDKDAAVREVGRILKPGGRLLIIEFKKDVIFGPPFKLSPEEVEHYFSKEGFVREGYAEVSPYHYMLVLKKVR
ncbi:methyltransferase domain-containing protein [Vulcanisaeta distributa]|uniref:Methyltransferase type 11 n=1 Tax=Vulcanisaeta distributa (strain DSM 14429 / JCM 11212 / NBRC 100878 / IC-017) TaxID=572478 RepID=E1QNU5_VULDI|nr:methyltransferase domain-containing protein [Vulcanisaeta distributa]ADN50191.1 Methyltransferase type 11 [Vulcanisaeta distributa DSM 14429]